MSAQETWEEGLDKARKKWEQSKSSSDYETYAMACATYLCSSHFERLNEHWFCGAPKTHSIAVSSLIMFSFDMGDETPENADAHKRYKLYEEKFTKMLASCERCSVSYQCSIQDFMEKELIGAVKLPTHGVQAFLKELRRKDRSRLSEQLSLNPMSVPVLSEILWSEACMMVSINSVISTGVLNGNPEAVGACPGLMMLQFSQTAELRTIGNRSLKEHTAQYAEAWETPQKQAIFLRMFVVCLKRNMQALERADLTWFRAALFLKMFAAYPKVVADVFNVCVEELQKTRIPPGLGTHYLVSVCMEIHNSLSPSRSVISLSSLDKLVDFVTQHPSDVLSNRPSSVDAVKQPTLDIAEYQKLTYDVVLAWYQEYLQADPGAPRLVKPSKFLLDLPSDSFERYNEACSAVFHAMARFPRDLYLPVIKSRAKAFCTRFQHLQFQDIQSLWLFQISTQAEAMDIYSFWKQMLTSSSFSRFVFASPENMELVIQLLQVSMFVAIPSSTTNSATSTTHNGGESVIKEMLETLIDSGETTSLIPVLHDEGALKSLMLMWCRQDKYISLAAEEFIKQALDEETGGESTVGSLVQHNAVNILTVMESILRDASSRTDTSWLPLMTGIIQSALQVLDQVYSIRDGVDTTGNEKVLRLLHEFWTRSWLMVDNVIKNVRQWAQNYKVVPVLTACLEFGQGLLAKFRLLDADLTSGLQEPERSWGAELAEPAIDCITNMGDMLKLNVTDLLAMALSIIVEILGLMRSFEVPIPHALTQLFEELATGKRVSRLDETQIRELMSACNISQAEISRLLEIRASGKAKPVSKAPITAITQSTQAAAAGKAQMSISDFFQSTNGQKPPIPQRSIVNNTVVPKSFQQQTSINAIRAQLEQQQHRPGATKPRFGVIHPERPPGFNVKKPVSTTTTTTVSLDSSSSGDDDDDDTGGALSALGAKPKDYAEASARLREAYQKNRSKNAPGLITPTISSQQQAKLVREREEQMMKKRLMVTPVEMYREILQWDYYATKPTFKANQSIPNKFDNVQQYQAIMSPLLYLEAWEQIQNTKLELKKSKPYNFSLVFGKRVKVDGFVDVYVSVAKASFSEAGIAEGDLLVLAYDPNRSGELIEPKDSLPHSLARVKEGTIKYHGGGGNSGGAANNQFVDFQIRLTENHGFLAPLNTGAVMSCFSIGGVRTLEREFISLMALPYYDILDNILQAKPAIAHDNELEIERIKRQQNLNTSQATAVCRSLENTGFSLIQGPPGTGKTKTILSIIGAYFTNNSMVTQASGEDVSATKKILVCAPSNAAVDEIVLRLKQGVIDSNGKEQKLNVLRLGRTDMISEQVRDVCLDNLVVKEMNASAEPADGQLRSDHTALIVKRNEIKKKLGAGEERLDVEEVRKLESELKSVSGEIREKRYALDMQRDRLEQARKQRDAHFRKQQHDVLTKSQVVCTTLSAASHPLLVSMSMKFETVVVDEAAQCIELSALIPMKYGAKNCIMVGDPNQLPPTVISQEATRLKYNQSLFVRMFQQWKDVPGAICMLDTQFRMHPDISSFPSQEFYRGKLKDASGLAEKLHRQWHDDYPALAPYTFFDVQGRHERANGLSLRNREEAKAALGLVKFLLRKYPNAGSIGVISPYREQIRYLRQVFVDSEGSDILSLVDFNSVDGFQGQEKDIIIMSCVRAADSKSDHIGFLGDVRRLNVAITRAKTSMWILGNHNSLKVNSVWNALIEDASNRGRLVNITNNDIRQAIERFRPRHVATIPAPPREMSNSATNATSNFSSSDHSSDRAAAKRPAETPLDTPSAKKIETTTTSSASESHSSSSPEPTGVVRHDSRQSSRHNEASENSRPPPPEVAPIRQDHRQDHRQELRQDSRSRVGPQRNMHQKRPPSLFITQRNRGRNNRPAGR